MFGHKHVRFRQRMGQGLLTFYLKMKDHCYSFFVANVKIKKQSINVIYYVLYFRLFDSYCKVFPPNKY